MNLGIIGTGGLARETILITNELIMKKNFNYKNVFFIEFDEYYNSNLKNLNVLKLSECDFKKFHFVIAVADCKIRERIYLELKEKVKFTSIISPNSYLSPDIKYDYGLIVMPFCYLT